MSHEQHPVVTVDAGRGWKTGQDRTRLLVTLLWDGRCGHCWAPLVRIKELGVDPRPLDVDHAHPSASGGSDHVMNYIASCDSCNRRRKQTPIEDDRTIRSLLRARRAIVEEFDDYAERSASTDPAISAPFWTAVRCAEHGWHIHGSPAYWDCRRELELPDGTIPFAEEWWSRFGARAGPVLEFAHHESERHGLAGLDRLEVLCHLPRYAFNADHALELLRNTPTPTRYRDLEPAPMHHLSAIIPLASTTAAASVRRRDFKATLALHAHLKDHGIDWLGIARLWTNRHWPSSHLFYHRKAVLALAASGKRKSLARLAALDTSRAVDEYLAQISAEPNNRSA